jgi:hypothetical protein
VEESVTLWRVYVTVGAGLRGIGTYENFHYEELLYSGPHSTLEQALHDAHHAVGKPFQYPARYTVRTVHKVSLVLCARVEETE